MTTQVDSSTLEKWQKLTRLVISLTKKGKMKWKETPRDDEFLTSQAKTTIVLRQTASSNGVDVLYTFTLRDAEGKIVDQFDDEVLDQNGEGVSYFGELNDLIAFIRRDVTGADEVVNELLRLLEKDDKDDLLF